MPDFLSATQSTRQFNRASFLLITGALLIAACIGRESEVPTIIPTASIPPAQAIPVPSLAATDTQTSTPLSTVTHTPPAAPTTTGLPSPNLSGGSILGISLLSGKRLMVSVTFPERIEGKFRAVVNERDYECISLAEYPDRLYCIGIEPPPGSEAIIRIFALKVEGPLFEAVFAVPHRPVESGPGQAVEGVKFGGSLGNNYSPSTVAIKAGDAVEWQGDFGSHPLASEDGLWAAVSTGSTFRFTFTSPGTYRFYCLNHGAPGGAGMSGQVIVSAP